MSTNAQRQARHRQARAARGIKTISVALTPASVAALAIWKTAGVSTAQAINGLLEGWAKR